MAPYVASAEILINAPIDLIWSINLDLGKYKEWNPFIYDVTNIPKEVIVGSKYTLQVQFANGSRVSSTEMVTEVVAPYVDANAGGVSKAVWAYKAFGWLQTLRIVNGTRFHWLEQQEGSSATLYRTEEAFTGLGLPLLPLAQVQDGFQRQTLALKDRAEAFAKARK